MDSLRRDFTFALRNLARSPGFVAVIVVTLALGIGANVAIFTVVDGMLLEALPYRDASRVVRIWDSKPSQGWNQASLSAVNFQDWRQRAHAFEDMAIFQSTSYNLSDEGDPERIEAIATSANLMRILGREPLAGRDFRAEEDATGAAPVVIVSDRLWQRRFAGNPALVGSTLRLDGVPHTVVGVMPSDFFFPGPSTDAWVPTDFPDDPDNRGNRSYAAVARLADGVSRSAAQADLAAVAAELEREFPTHNAGWSVVVRPAIDDLLGNQVPQLFGVLLLAVGFVALIACANIASLLLSRSVVREREVSLRSVLGATRTRLLRQLLTETAVLALAGGAAGVVTAFPMVRLLLTLAPPEAPRVANIAIDGSVLVYAAGLTLATALVFGLVPALQASRPDLNTALKDGGRSSGGSPRHRLLRGLVAAEVALATALLAMGVLTIRGLQQTLRQDPGFDSTDLVTFQLNLPQTKYAEAHQRSHFFARLLQDLRALPGVDSASLVQTLPLGRSNSYRGITIEGIPLEAPDDRKTVGYMQIGDQYFEALDIPVLGGRALGPADMTEEARTVVVNRTFAERYWPGEDPLGRRLRFGWEGSEVRPWLTIVGVTADVRHTGLDDPPRPEVYAPYALDPPRRMAVVVETRSDLETMAPALRATLARIDPDQPLYSTRTMRQVIVEDTEGPRAIAQILGGLAVGALLLAAVGIYGVITFSLNQRRHEIGIRRAIGAKGRDIVLLTLRQGLAPVAVGMAVGLALSAALARVLSALMPGMESTDPTGYAGALLALLAVAVVSNLLPASRALRADPLAELRHE